MNLNIQKVLVAKESVSAVVKVLVTERLLVRGTRDKMLVAVVE